MLQKSRACFFWGRRSAAGSTDQTHPGGRPETGNKCTFWVDISDIFQKGRFFKMSKSKSCNVSGSIFRISKTPDMKKSRKSENIRVFGPHSYQLGWVLYIPIFPPLCAALVQIPARSKLQRQSCNDQDCSYPPPNPHGRGMASVAWNCKSSKKREASICMYI